MTNGTLNLLLGDGHGAQVFLERSTNLAANAWETLLDWEPASTDTIPANQYTDDEGAAFFRAKTRSPL